MNDSLQLSGKLTLTLISPDGQVVDSRDIDNLIVQTGKNFFANAGLFASASPFTNIAVGTSGTPAALSDTILGAEISRLIFTSSSVAANVITMVVTFPAGMATGALQEAGIFNAASAGTMLSHVVFSVINKGVLDSLTISWAVTLG
jgi:hypothetical protein